MALEYCNSKEEKSTSVLTWKVPFLFHRLMTLIITYICVHETIGGICWYTITRSDHCRHLYKINTSQDDCCQNNLPSMSWSPHKVVSHGEIFYWEHLSKGASKCQPCHRNCKNVQCPSQMVCKMRKGRPKCVCKPKCSKMQRKSGNICGNDGLTYKSYCRMMRINCKKKSHVIPAYWGRCKRSCRDVKCLENKQCIEDQNGLPHCVHCKKSCRNTSYHPFCGEDGITYASLCHIRQAACRKGRAIRIAYNGHCRSNASCFNTVCSNGMKCLVNPRNGQPQCEDCQRKCSPLSKRIRVCGTDGVTYSSYCQLRNVSCNMGISITTRRSGSCYRGLNRRRKCRHCKNRRSKKRRMESRKRKVQIKLRLDDDDPYLSHSVVSTVYNPV